MLYGLSLKGFTLIKILQALPLIVRGTCPLPPEKKIDTPLFDFHIIFSKNHEREKNRQIKIKIRGKLCEIIMALIFVVLKDPKN